MQRQFFELMPNSVKDATAIFLTNAEIREGCNGKHFRTNRSRQFTIILIDEKSLNSKLELLKEVNHYTRGKGGKKTAKVHEAFSFYSKLGWEQQAAADVCSVSRAEVCYRSDPVHGAPLRHLAARSIRFGRRIGCTAWKGGWGQEEWQAQRANAGRRAAGHCDAESSRYTTALSGFS